MSFSELTDEQKNQVRRYREQNRDFYNLIKNYLYQSIFKESEESNERENAKLLVKNQQQLAKIIAFTYQNIKMKSFIYNDDLSYVATQDEIEKIKLLYQQEVDKMTRSEYASETYKYNEVIDEGTTAVAKIYDQCLYELSFKVKLFFVFNELMRLLQDVNIISNEPDRIRTRFDEIMETSQNNAIMRAFEFEHSVDMYSFAIVRRFFDTFFNYVVGYLRNAPYEQFNRISISNSEQAGQIRTLTIAKNDLETQIRVKDEQLETLNTEKTTLQTNLNKATNDLSELRQQLDSANQLAGERQISIDTLTEQNRRLMAEKENLNDSMVAVSNQAQQTAQPVVSQGGSFGPSGEYQAMYDKIKKDWEFYNEEINKDKSLTQPQKKEILTHLLTYLDYHKTIIRFCQRMDDLYNMSTNVINNYQLGNEMSEIKAVIDEDLREGKFLEYENSRTDYETFNDHLVSFVNERQEFKDLLHQKISDAADNVFLHIPMFSILFCAGENTRSALRFFMYAFFDSAIYFHIRQLMHKQKLLQKQPQRRFELEQQIRQLEQENIYNTILLTSTENNVSELLIMNPEHQQNNKGLSIKRTAINCYYITLLQIHEYRKLDDYNLYGSINVFPCHFPVRISKHHDFLIPDVAIKDYMPFLIQLLNGGLEMEYTQVYPRETQIINIDTSTIQIYYTFSDFTYEHFLAIFKDIMNHEKEQLHVITNANMNFIKTNCPFLNGEAFGKKEESAYIEPSLAELWGVEPEEPPSVYASSKDDTDDVLNGTSPYAGGYNPWWMNKPK